MQRHTGFTLLELLISISIVAVLTAIAVPGFEFMNNRRITQSQVENLQRTLSMARQTAIAKNRQTIVCPSSNGNACSINTDDWSYGYMVYIDRNGNGRFNIESDQLIEYVAGVKNVATRQDSSHLAHQLKSDRTWPVRFSAQGSAIGSNQTLTFCDSEHEARFEIIVSNEGRIRVSNDVDSSCS